MATKVKVSKRSAQNSNISSLCTPTKTDKTKIQKPNTPTYQPKSDDMRTIHEEIKLNQNTAKEKIASLERENATMRSKIVDLQARSSATTCCFSTFPKQLRRIQQK